MTRKSFGEDSFTQSVTLQNVSANLDLVRRLEHLSLAELGKRTGLSDRHLDSLIRMRSNVTVLVLEQIAESLGIPFLTFIGTRLDANIPGGRSGFLDGLRDENAFTSVDERRQSPSAVYREATSQQQLPTGLTPDVTNLLRSLISMQEQLSQEQASLARQVENLTSLLGREPTVVGAPSKRATSANLSDVRPALSAHPAKGPKTKKAAPKEGQSTMTRDPEHTVRRGPARKASEASRSSRRP